MDAPSAVPTPEGDGPAEPSLIGRTAAMLRALATGGPKGLSLTALAKAVGLPNATVHRLLAQLQRERLVMRIEASRCYVVGPLAYELGLSATERFDIRRLLHPALAALAVQTGETVYLVQRSGHEAVCVDLISSGSPTQATTLTIGSRRPLGLGAGGLAILAALPADEAEGTLASVRDSIQRDWHLSEAFVRDSLALTQASGFSFIRNRITPGVTAVGRSFRDGLGRVIGAVTVAGINRRIGPMHRQQQLKDRLQHAANTLEQTLQARRWPLQGVTGQG